MGLLVSSHINRLGCGNCLRGDRLATTQAKMEEYLDNGCRLGWWMNRKQPPEALDAPTSVSATEVFPGFSLDLTAIW